MYYFHIRGGPILLRRIIFVNKVSFYRTGDIPSVEFEVLRLKSACYEFFMNFIVLYFIVEGLKKKKKREREYNNINVSIAKILGLVVKEEGLFFIFFFHSIHRSGKNLDSQRRFK